MCLPMGQAVTRQYERSAASEDGAADGPDQDAALLRNACAGDEGAWRLLVDRYARRVFALARSRCGDAEVAEEVTQHVFVKAAEHLTGGGYEERGRFESWLFRIAMNRIRDEVRRRTRRATHEGDGALLTLSGGDEEERPDASTLLRLRSALARLGDADREVIELRHHAGLEFKQIASLLEEPLGTVLARHHRALRKLRGWMDEQDGGAT